MPAERARPVEVIIVRQTFFIQWYSPVNDNRSGPEYTSLTQGTPYRPLNPESLRLVLSELPLLAVRLGGTPSGWNIREVSDGNLNSVWLIHGPSGSLCAKQSLPHVRVDPSWKMPLDRTTFEAGWLKAVTPLAPEMVPEFLYFDPQLFLLVTACLDDHVTFTEALIQGVDPLPVARQIGHFVARTAFHTSWRGGPFEKMFQLESFFSGNTTLTRITVDLVLTDPYYDHPRNHYHPALKTLVEQLHTDPTIHRAVSHMQSRFFTAREALLHGDLHSGSIMVGPNGASVIDGEFACIGPTGFDCGMFVASLILASFAAQDTSRRTQIRQAAAIFHESFLKTYCEEWLDNNTDTDLAPAFLTRHDATEIQRQQQEECDRIVSDMAGFTAMEVIRRLTGYAHTSHFDALPETEKGHRQYQALSFAIELLSNLKAAPEKLFHGH
ncbi:S-methyl-5-thioribose kinase [Acetobacter sp.]|uniref:S-methyl-5-thioribose kinase n=1 Tax=Acetobacter sp. TaxID=440 RepID=UPI0025B9C48D|nr:S-methyl-5-thioribose kinase [Acetobacter sp.]MCH4091286.1 S-methyl-5-thioribose kinase [Acetobacter sp.]MCI1299264.1 S-methyl-5-thioribose kinase [Acetobacter sp.]MCI1316732.1 S-methyl-5-thioribose kinase [Acetobacter sp.]